MENNRSSRTQVWQLIFSFFYILIFPFVLFFLAGDWGWIEGWGFSILLCLFSYVTIIYLYVRDPALLDERFGSPFQEGQKSWDKVFLVILFLVFIAWIVVMPLDAKRYRWSPQFPLWLKVIGALLYFLSFPMFLATFRENTFAAPVVKMQKERGQKVISTGLYRIVRHPLYSGASLLFVGGPLLLGSSYGLVLGLLLVILVALRSIGEENMLKQELEGYVEYTRKVRWRLIPFIF